MDFEIINFLRLLIRRTYVTLDEVMSATDSTQRQVLYRLEKVNAMLIGEDVAPIYIGERKEFIVENETRAQLIDLLYIGKEVDEYYLNRDERMFTLFLMLFIHTEFLSLQHFIQHLKVSKSTILQDFKELQSELKKYSITIQNDRINGYTLSGQEIDLRAYLMQQILAFVTKDHNSTVLDMFLKAYRLESFDYMRLIVHELAQKHDIVFVEDRLLEFIYIFILLKARVHYVDVTLFNDETIPHVDVMRTFKEYTFTKQLCDFFKITTFDDNDISYLTSWIVGISVGDVESGDEDCLFISDIVGKILSRFEMISGMHYDDVEVIFRHVYSHMRPAYYRLLFKHPIYNPLVDTIYEKYLELYNIVKEVLKPLSELFSQPVPREEIAYLTLHFSSLYAQMQHVQKERNHALVVCSNGVGSSVLLYNELKSLFPDIDFYYPIEIASFSDFSKPYDLIFTTQFFDQFKNVKLPVIKVNPVMSMEERYKLSQEVQMHLGHREGNPLTIVKTKELVKKYYGDRDIDRSFLKELLSILHPNPTHQESDYEDIRFEYRLKDMIECNTIMLDVVAENDLAALKISGDLMIEHGYITQNYSDTVMRQYKNESNHLVIAPLIALPHTLPSHGAMKCGLGIMRLKEAVPFKNEIQAPVRYIFYLSPTDNYSHISAMSELLELLSDESFMHFLENVENPQILVEVIHNRFKD